MKHRNALKAVSFAVVAVLLGGNTAFAMTFAASDYEPHSTAAAYREAVAHQHTAAALREQARETGNWNAYDQFMWPGLITTSTPVFVSEETIRWKQSLVDNAGSGANSGTTKYGTKSAGGTKDDTAAGYEKKAAITNPYEYKMQYMNEHPQQYIDKDIAFVGQMGGYNGHNTKPGDK